MHGGLFSFLIESDIFLIFVGLCQSALGMYSRDISLSQIHAPNAYSQHPRHKIRPYADREKMIYDAWIMPTSAEFPTIWAMIDLGTLHYVTSIMIMGEFTIDSYVKTFRLSYSIDDITYTDHVDEQGNVAVRVNRNLVTVITAFACEYVLIQVFGDDCKLLIMIDSNMVHLPSDSDARNTVYILN